MTRGDWPYLRNSDLGSKELTSTASSESLPSSVGASEEEEGAAVAIIRLCTALLLVGERAVTEAWGLVLS